MRKLHLCVLLSLFAFCSALFADQVVLKNGDHLTGTIEKSDDKTLLIKTEFAGEVTVKWPAVQEVTSTQPLHVALSGGKTVVGPVTTTDGRLAVVTPMTGTSMVSPAYHRTTLGGSQFFARCFRFHSSRFLNRARTSKSLTVPSDSSRFTRSILSLGLTQILMSKGVLPMISLRFQPDIRSNVLLTSI
jgi:hypothetical protein